MRLLTKINKCLKKNTAVGFTAILRWNCCILDTARVMRTAYGGVRVPDWQVTTAADGPQTKTMMRFNGPRATLPAVDQRPGVVH